MINRTNTQNRRNPLQYECRTVQVNGNSLSLNLPSVYTEFLDINAGDMMKIQLIKDQRKIVAQKVMLDFDSENILREA
jgi:antitoxin component of MazEF toxin-antitoxin module